MSLLGQSAGLLFKIDADSSGVKKEFAAIDGSINSLGGKFGSLADIASVGVAGIAAIGAIAVTVGQQLFSLAMSASEYGSSIFDAKEKTGLTAETLSVLRVAADNAGSSFEGISGSVSKFAVLVGQANQGNEKAIATLEQYGIKSRDLNGALNEAIAVIAAEKDETLQAAAAKDLFKDRTGQIIPVIKQLGGDLKKATEDAKRLGLTLSEDDVKAADDLGDAFGVLSAQIKAGASRFALQYAPQITGAIQTISNFVANNSGVWSEWGRFIANTITGTWNVLQGFGKAADDILTGITLGLANQEQRWSIWGYAARGALMLVTAGLSEVIWGLNKIGELINANKRGLNETDTGSQRDIISRNVLAASNARNRIGSGGDALASRGGGGKGGGADESASKELQAQIQEQEFLLGRLEKAYADTMKRIRDEFKVTGDTDAFTEAANKANRELGEGANKILAVLEALERKSLKDPTATEKRNLDNKQQSRVDDLNILKDGDVEENGELIQEAVAKIFAGLKELAQKNADEMSQIVRENAYAEIDEVISKNEEILRSEFSTKRQRQDAHDEIFAVIQRNTRVLAYENSVRHEQSLIELNTWRDKQSEAIKKTIQDEELQKAALEQVNGEYRQRLDLLNQIFDAESKKIESASALPVIEPGTTGSAWGDLLQGVKGEFTGTALSAVTAGIETLRTAFAGLGQAIGQVVNAWVLYGSAGASARKVTAQILAGIAQQAAVQAVFQLAEGFAKLAMAYFGVPNAGPSATAHFISAGIYASIAGIAAVAGRATAGNAFKQQVSSATGGTSGGGQNGNGGDLRYTTAFGGLGGNESPLTGLIRQQNQTLERQIFVLGQVEETVNQFNTKVTTMSPDHVVAMGAAGASRDIREAYESELGDSRATDSFMRQAGFAR